ncbi:L-aspartate oxidase [Zafaria cholistanensis]|uniref:L-aspartate oxidase n=1 Tax=Zafaria cholistanensis TaxID=1682741 RepID=A0A5A7NPY5_9MICC|nr:FAD-binding protein [Zafaria cholistanensis]GER21858.1 L-aspartate oxidase [Zafaria cholistanensis]
MTRRPSLAIVGSGVAGLYAAVAAAERGHAAVLLTKDRLQDSNSWYAQGGLAAVGPDGAAAGDSVEQHVADTLRAGARLNDAGAVRLLCAAAWPQVRRLAALGSAFDTDATGTRYLLGLEAAHAHPRILHAGGDATGRALSRALIAACRRLEAQGRLEIREGAFVTALLHDAGRVAGVRLLRAGQRTGQRAGARELVAAGAGARGAGVSGMSGAGERDPLGAGAGEEGCAEEVRADVVLLATGGIGALYPQTTNPSGATGDGAALAWEAGAVLADAEFVQFHPTLVPHGPFMVSEAVRGEGAVLLDGTGRRFMPDVHPDAELAPRDVVARAIHRTRAATGAVHLDATGVERVRGAGFLARRFPAITARLAELGFDLATAPVPVAEAQHYWMGGVLTDGAGRTTVPGLLAAGETACTGVHGANRLASNSLLEALVYAWRAVAALDPHAPDTEAPGSAAATEALAGVHALDTAPAGPARPHPAPPDLADLHAVTGTGLGVERDAAGLRAAADRLARLQADHHRVRGPQDAGRTAVELSNLLVLGRVVASAAALRENSLGAHCRTDHPQPPATAARHGFVRRTTTQTGPATA